MQHDAWSWPVQTAEAQQPDARRQPRLWPSAVLADVPGWGGFEAQSQPARGEWPRQATEEAAVRHAAPDADEQQLAEQVRRAWRTRPHSNPSEVSRFYQMLLRSMRSIGLSVPQNEAFAQPRTQRHELAGTRGRRWAGEAEQHCSKADSRRQVRKSTAWRILLVCREPKSFVAARQRLVSVRRTVFVRDIDQEVRSLA